MVNLPDQIPGTLVGVSRSALLDVSCAMGSMVNERATPIRNADAILHPPALKMGVSIKGKARDACRGKDTSSSIL